MVRGCILLVLTIWGSTLQMLGQTNDSIIALDNTSEVVQDLEIKNDTILWVKDDISVDESLNQVLKIKDPFKPDPNKAVLYSAIFPGLGQVYNRKYWKLPIVYGGFLGLVYAISWNGRLYGDYTDAYKAIMSDNPKSQENIDVWGPLINKSKQPSQMTDSEIEMYRNSFKRNRDSYRRYRDLSIIGAVALYGLCMIDAYVDAHLFDFDVSPDLSLRIEPQVQTDYFSKKSFGVQCSFKF